jgi:uncharacterized protein YjdB
MLLAILALSCGGETEPPGDAAVAGLWNATVTIHGQLPLGGPVACSVSWAMKIDDFGTPGAPDLFTVVPFTPVYSCDNGYTSPWEYKTYSFLVYQDSSQVVFLTTSRLDTFLVATLSGSSLTGRLGKYFYQDGTFRATRRSGADPNLQPSMFAVFGSDNMEIGDTSRAAARTEDGYLRELDTLTITWTSRSPAYATIDDGGLMHGVSPGTAWMVGETAGLRDSFLMTVLPPAASVEITSAPDSIIVSDGYLMQAVAKDGSGQPLPGRHLTWESSNPAVATVDGDGGVVGRSPGTVTITVRSTVVSANRTFPVLPKVASVTLSSPGIVVPLGGTLQVTATAKDSAGNVLTGRPVQWEAGSGDGSIVTLDQHGLVTGVTAGPAPVVATVENVSTLLDVTAQMDGPLTATALGEQHSCGLGTTGHIYCWGQNALGQLGPDAAGWLGANLVASPEHFSVIAASGSHTCALNTAGGAFCWGYDSFGQLGGTPSGTGRMVAVSGGLTFSRLAAGSEFTCGLSSGSAWCWGLNGLGQLGRGTDDLSTHTAPAAVVGGHAFTAIAAGDRTACGLTAGGQAWCWGSNETGQLGLGTQDNNPHSTPVHAAPALTFSAIAPGQHRTCGITTGSGVVQCWGGSEGLDPAPFDATSGYVEIAAGGTNFCRVDGAGTVFCWGEGVFPEAPSRAMSGVKLGTGHACARQVGSGRTLCWGETTYAQLGDGSAYPSGPVEPLGQP